MDTMKDSKIKWMGLIPKSWTTTKLKYTAMGNGTLFLDGDWIESDVIEDEGIRYLTSGNIGARVYKEQGSGYISEKTFVSLHCLKVFPGDIMISRLNEPVGRACFVPDGEEYYVVAVDDVILRPSKKYSKRFLVYVMNCSGYTEHANLIARGATMSRISRFQLGQFFIPVPSEFEQERIADHLDRYCAKLDKIIADLERQIELLQKYKKSLITETVTKGLDKNVEMKDSGIEWATKIPVHWEIMRMQDIAKYKKGPFGSAITTDMFVEKGKNTYKVYEQKNAINSNAQLGWYYLSYEDYRILKDFTVSPGDIIVSCAGTIGKCYILPNNIEPGIINQALMRVKINKEFDKYYFIYLFDVALKYMNEKYSNGSAIKNIPPFSVLKKQCVPVPPINEQVSIVKKLDSECSFLEKLMSEKKRQLQLAQKYEQSSIYEYVTGKKRVKEAE